MKSLTPVAGHGNLPILSFGTKAHQEDLLLAKVLILVNEHSYAIGKRHDVWDIPYVAFELIADKGIETQRSYNIVIGYQALVQPQRGPFCCCNRGVKLTFKAYRQCLFQ